MWRLPLSVAIVLFMADVLVADEAESSEEGGIHQISFVPKTPWHTRFNLSRNQKHDPGFFLGRGTL